MTEQDRSEIIALAGQLGISNDNPEFTLIILSRFYGLADGQIIKILGDREKGLMAKHLGMMAEIFGKDTGEGGWEPGITERDKLERLLYSSADEKEIRTDDVLRFVIKSSLSAAQIKEVRDALQKGMPPDDVLLLAKENRPPDVIRAAAELCCGSRENSGKMPGDMKPKFRNCFRKKKEKERNDYGQ